MKTATDRLRAVTGITCFRTHAAEDQTQWLAVSDPPGLRTLEGVMYVETPPGRRGTVNGLDILGGVQLVVPGDLVRLFGGGASDTSYFVGRALPSLEPGQGRLCQFTGQGVDDDAVRCACGALYCPDVADQLLHCPQCGLSLNGQLDPPEEVLL